MAECPNCHETNPEAGAACPRCDGFHYVPEESVEEAANDPRIGRMAAGKYVILGLINEGGMGAVYRALQLPVEREVAFKVLRTELKDSDNGRDRFIREARAVSRLNHANIITLYDFGFEDGKHPYMVMEYAPGKSLAKWLRTEPLTTERILRITAQILSALTEAHSHGIVHRDLKPENMIISPKANDVDRVKLLDFGIARLINEGATRGITREGEVFGTPHYMAPEQAQGRKDIGPPADVYAVGIMLYEMLAGECPFDAPTPLAVLFMHINDPIPPLQPRQDIELVPGLEAIILKATSKEPIDRYQSAAEMLTDLSQVFGSMTGMHQGIGYGDPSQEFMMGDTMRPTTPAPSPGALGHRQPHFTPMTSEIGSGVNAFDPDPSHVGDAPTIAPPPDVRDPFSSGEFAESQFAGSDLPGQGQSLEDLDEPPASRNKFGLVIALIVLLIAAGGLIGVIALSGDKEAQANALGDEPGVDEPTEDPAPPEMAVTEKPFDVVVEPITDRASATASANEEEDELSDDDNPEDEAEKPSPEIAQKPAPEHVEPKPKPDAKPASQAKPEPAAKPRPEPKPEPKPEVEQKPTPVKFAPVPTKWN